MIHRAIQRHTEYTIGRCVLMIEMMTVKSASLLWNMEERRITALCREGRILGATKQGNHWLIPADAERPTDKRVKTGAYKKERTIARLPLPIGISDYRLASTEYYYVDKTMLIKDFLDERPMVSLFTRPRRFGKTLNMDMLRTFFEKTEEDTSVYFKDKAIWRCGERYQSYQGKYPVIFISFKDVKFETWEETKENISHVLRKEFERHKEILQSEEHQGYDKRYFETILNGNATETELVISLQMLSAMLDKYHRIAPIIIIDEYDTPIHQGHTCGFYDKVVLFMRNFFSGGFKDNKHLSYGFMTGILCVAKESIFSGLNNVKVNSVLDNRYSSYFGFTEQEVKELAEYYGVPEKYEEICQWYDGYLFGKTEIFNPWSVINYFNNDCVPMAFWQATGNNDVIGEILEQATEDIYRQLNELLQGKSILTFVDTGVIYPQIQKSSVSVYSFLMMTGYLKVLKKEGDFGGEYLYEVSLPNKEIALVYRKEVLERYQNIISQDTATYIQQSIYTGNVEEFKTQLEKLLLQSVSCYDTVGENFYHGLVLGLCAVLDKHYYISSNRESGEGRYDIQLQPRNQKFPGVLLELKAGKNCAAEDLKKLSVKAVQQIKDRKYDTDMRTAGVEHIWKYGIAFCGKQVEITKE